jgi:hypothetical protein
MAFFLTNGEVAWQLSEYLGKSYKAGFYQTPPGWELVTGLPKRWRQHPGGEFRSIDSLDKLLKEAGFGGR